LVGDLNPHMLDEHKEVRNGVLGEGQRLLEEDELQINEDVEDIDDGRSPRQGGAPGCLAEVAATASRASGSLGEVSNC
jgi:hypothetical protein